MRKQKRKKSKLTKMRVKMITKNRMYHRTQKRWRQKKRLLNY